MPTYRSLASGNFVQDWSDTGALTTNDVWDPNLSIIGYLGDYTSATTSDIDPRTLLTQSLGAIDLIANQNNPNTNISGGVAEFQITNPTIALQGSGTADAPSIVLYLDATGRQNIHLTASIRDIDGSADNAVQQFNVQYRTSPTGAWINAPGGYFADVTSTGATMVTSLDIILPPDANNAATLEIRMMTTNAGGSDEWVGIDDINVSSQPLVVISHGTLAMADASVVEGDAGSAALTFTVNRNGGSDGAVSATWTVGFGTANSGDLAAGQPLTGTVNFADGQTSATITVQVAGDTEYEPNESLTVTLSAILTADAPAETIHEVTAGVYELTIPTQVDITITEP